MRTGAHFGVKTVRFGVDFDAVRAHVRDALEAVAPLQSRERLKALGVRVITGAARFVDRKTLAVEGLEIKARRFVIATGSLPALPAIAGLAETRISPATIFSTLPNVRAISLSLAPAPPASKWRKHFGGLAPKSPCSIGLSRSRNTIGNARPSYSTRWPASV
jgi:hypothetical protein